MAFDTPREGSDTPRVTPAKPVRDRRSSRAVDAPRINDETPERTELGVRQTDTAEHRLEQLRQALRICSPVLWVRLRFPDDAAAYMETRRGNREEHILWDADSLTYRWKSGAEPIHDDATDVDSSARAVARTMGAPVRSM